MISVACRDAVRRGGVAIAWVEQRRGVRSDEVPRFDSEDVRVIVFFDTCHKRFLYATHHRTLTANSRTSAHTSFSLYIAFTFFTRPAEPALITFV